eukprot:UN33458
MDKNNIERNIVIYNELIRLCSREKEVEKAKEYLKEMETQGIQKDSITIKIFLTCLRHDVDLVLAWFKKFRNAGYELGFQAHITVLEALARAGKVKDVYNFVEYMKHNPTVEFNNDAAQLMIIKVHAEVGDVDQVDKCT